GPRRWLSLHGYSGRRRSREWGGELLRGRIRVRLFLAVWAVVAGSIYLSSFILLSTPAGASAGGGGATLFATALIVGAIAGALVRVLSVRSFDESVRTVTDAARRMQEGDLTVRARVGKEEDVGELGATFDQLAGSFSRTVGELRDERDLVSRILDGMQEGV